MGDKQLPKNEFVREKIKDKPKNHKRIIKRLCMSGLCGIVFALGVCIVLFLMIPVLQEKWNVSQNVQEPQDTQPVTQTEEPQDTQDRDEPQMQPQALTLEDYQRIQMELYAIGNQANKSIVTITSVVNDTDWFNNSYELEDQGSGTIIGEREGKLLILTEKKVIKNASEISVTFVNNAVAPAELMKYDGNTGLAVLAVSESDLEETTLASVEVMAIGSSNSVHKGSIVIALGSPLGTNYSILTGNITATNNEITTEDNNYSVYTTDIVASQSGSGILINTDGELVGVVMQGYGVDSASTLTAVTVSELEPVMELLFADKDIPYLGVQISTVTDKIASQYDIPKGVYIKKVTMDSPAMGAGLQSGDVILSLAGEDVTTVSAFRNVLLGLNIGETYPVVIMREGTNGYQKMTCKAQVGVLN